MLTSMSNGVSALMSFQEALNVESNNASNTQSTAFKTDSISFSDMFYQRRTGQGVNPNSPIKDFSQGQLIPSNSDFDFAISGEGFFTVEDPKQPDKIYYTRAGNFKSDKNNNLVDNNGMFVMGIKPTVTGDIITSKETNNIASTIVKTEDSTTSINTYMSDYVSGTDKAGATGESGNNYKTTGSNNNDIQELISAYNSALKSYSIDPVEGEDAQRYQASVTFPKDNVKDGTYSVELKINGIKIQQSYDESIENTLNLLSNKISGLTGITSHVDTTTGELVVESMVPGKNMTVSQAKLSDNLVPVEVTQHEGGSGQKLIDATYAQLQSVINNINSKLETNNSSLPADEQLSADDLDKFKIKIATNKSEIQNLSSGDPIDFQPIELDLNKLGMNSTLYEKLIGGDITTVAAYPGMESDQGKLYLTDGDAKFLVGMLVPVTFTDKTLLDPKGDNLYSLSDNDVEPYFIKNAATVYGGYTENSNVDLSKELVNIMVYQKAYEANSKSITTSDELMKTALDLKTR